MNRVQCAVNAGPSLDAMRQLQVLTASDRELQWWKDFGQAASRRGIRSCIAVPLTLGGQVIGALGFYSRRSGAFDGCEELALAVAATAGASLLAATDGAGKWTAP